MPSKTIISYLIASLWLATGLVHAKEVTLPYKGLTLNANLELAAGKTIGDGVILITHGSQAHNKMEIIAHLQELLHEKGYNTLAINLSLGLDNRHGFYDCKQPSRFRHEDALDEIGAWLDWLQQKGVKKVVLLGHSRGGNQTAWFAAERDRPSLQAVVLMAPATADANSDAAYQARFHKPLAPLMKKANALVSAGKGDTLLQSVGFLALCDSTSVSATSFVSNYQSTPQRDTPKLLPKIKKPVLVLVAGNDEVVRNLDKAVRPYADGKRVQMAVVEASDHMFRDLYADDAVDTTASFLKQVGF